MYTYKLVTETWHRLLQLNGSPDNPPPLRISTIEIPIIIDQPNSHYPLQSDCASLFASLMYSTTQVTTQPAISPPPQDPTHEMRSLRTLCRLGHDQWMCKEQGLAVTLVLENRLDLLVVMPTGHGKSAVFMIPQTDGGSSNVIVSVP